jgi:hypothetical protein
VSVLSQIVPGDTTVPSSRAARWTGRTMSGSAARIGLLELLCVLAYALPWTSTLGAVLLTGFLGGAIAIHVRVGDPLWSHVLFPAYVGVLVWAGLILREDRLRALLRPRMAAQRVTRQHAAAARGAAR